MGTSFEKIRKMLINFKVHYDDLRKRVAIKSDIYQEPKLVAEISAFVKELTQLLIESKELQKQFLSKEQKALLQYWSGNVVKWRDFLLERLEK